MNFNTLFLICSGLIVTIPILVRFKDKKIKFIGVLSILLSLIVFVLLAFFYDPIVNTKKDTFKETLKVSPDVSLS